MFLRLRIGLSRSDVVQNDQPSARNIMVIAICVVGDIAAASVVRVGSYQARSPPAKVAAAAEGA
eukprot:7716753-Heterocapsa_arctica.AAC.1